MMHRIRQRPPRRGGLVRAMAVSAYARDQDRSAALAAGYDDFLTKPALPADVLQTVGRILLATDSAELRSRRAGVPAQAADTSSGRSVARRRRSRETAALPVGNRE